MWRRVFVRTGSCVARVRTRRRVAAAAVELATLHRWRGIEGPFASPALRPALRLAVRRRFVPVIGRGGARLRATC